MSSHLSLFVSIVPVLYIYIYIPREGGMFQFDIGKDSLKSKMSRVPTNNDTDIRFELSLFC